MKLRVLGLMRTESELARTLVTGQTVERVRVLGDDGSRHSDQGNLVTIVLWWELQIRISLIS